jgi:hypothetical protein
MIPSPGGAATRGEALKEVVAEIGRQLGYETTCGYEFTFPELALARGVSRYKPDCAWFSGERRDRNVTAIFAIDDGPSRKHRGGGVALADIVALRLGRRVAYVAVAPENRIAVATPPIELHRRYLGDKWVLDALLVPTFEPQIVAARVREFASTIMARQNTGVGAIQ